jgi:hypothetical protein
MTRDQVSKHNYAANFGTTGIPLSGPELENFPYLAKEFGTAKFSGAPFTKLPKLKPGDSPRTIRLSEITDGLSKTLFVSEVVSVHGNDIRGLIWYGHATGFTTYSIPNGSEQDTVPFRSQCEQFAENPPCMLANANRPNFMSSRSVHSGGVYSVMGDTAVQFVSDEIDLNVWRAMSTTQGAD